VTSSVDPVPAPPAAEPAPAAAPRDRLPLVLAAWTVLLVAGFALVLGFGRPLADPVDELTAAYAPATPVDEARARASAETIVRLQFPEFAGFSPSVERNEGFGEVSLPHWVVVYADPGGAAGVRVSITEQQGTVEVSAFP
jgi:hypothetical protein